MSRRILMADLDLTAALKAVALAKRARVRRMGAYVVIDEGQPDTAAPLKPAVPTVGRNERCPCGSGTKFKKCCLPR